MNQFLSPFTNKRTDKYGGSFEKRMRLIEEIIFGIRKTCGKEFPIGVRLSVDEFMGDQGITLEMGVKIAQHLEKIGVNHIHVSCGIYETGYHIIPVYTFPQACRKDLAKAVKDAVSIPVISINNIKEPKVAEQLLEEGVCDFVAVGRGQLADPEWANKARRGEDIAIRKCLGCLRCIDAIARGRHLECSVNPRLGRELEFLKGQK
ncbi:MAG: tRNA-dihydrouridine synthase [bacterium]